MVQVRDLLIRKKIWRINTRTVTGDPVSGSGGTVPRVSAYERWGTAVIVPGFTVEMGGEEIELARIG